MNFKIRHIFAGISITLGCLGCYFLSNLSFLYLIFIGELVIDPLVNSKKMRKILKIFQFIKIFSSLAILSIIYFVIPNKITTILITSPYLMTVLWIFNMAIVIERYIMVKEKMIVIGDNQVNLIEN